MKFKRMLTLLLAVSLLITTGSVSTLGIANGLNKSSNDTLATESENNVQEIYEAEDATLTKATVKSELDDYSGDGYVDGLTSGSSVTFKVKVDTAGDYGVRLRYVNGSDTTKNINVYVGDTLVRTAELTQTVNWNTWNTHLDSVALVAGENTITYKIDEGNTGSDLKFDKIALSRIYEAEDATLLGEIAVETEHAGYSGTAYASGFHNNGQGVQFTVDAPAAGEYSLVARYAAGQEGADGQSLSLHINGAKQQVVFGTLRNWGIWWDAQTTVKLNKGTNVIKYVKESNDSGSINMDYITLKQSNWSYAGTVESYTGNNTSELEFTLDNAKVRINSVASNMVKVWLEPFGRFDTKYDSFSVVNEEIDPQKLAVSDKGEYYQFTTGNMVVQINKAPFRVTYLDLEGNVLCENDEKSMGWSTDGELTVNNKLHEDEQFWGLGEKLNAFDRRGQELVMWSHDAYGAVNNSSVPSWENGRWYMSNPYFISSKGYSIFFDNTSRAVFDLGKNNTDMYSFGSYNPNPGGELQYYFTYGPSIKQINKTFTDLIGKTFFAPQWAYGNMQSHYGYTQADIERVAQTYRDKDIPLDTIVADIEWYEYLCAPNEWNKRNFPNPEGMLSKLKDLNIRMSVINDPNVTDRDNNQYFRDGDTQGMFVVDHSGKTKKVNWPWGGPSGLTDFFNPAAHTWWKAQMKTIMDQGVTTFWLDMNEPAKYNNDWLFWNKEGKAYGTLSEVKNAYAIKHNEALFNIVADRGERPFLLSRSGYTGSQRYVAPWTGDIMGSWQSMHEQINMGVSLSLSGYNYWGFDIGGFFSTVDNNQYKRWVELATFTPTHRFHYCNGVEEKEPWTHDSEDVSREYINLRYRLMPYMYSLTADNILGIGIEEGLGEGGTGVPLVRPMVMEYPTDQKTWKMDSQFMSGPSFLVAPVYEDSTVKDVYLPEGTWYDYKDGKTVYSGGGNLMYDAPVDTLPVFVKEGAIVPMQPVMQYMGEKPIDVLTLDIYPHIENGDSHFVLYEDDGITDSYKSGDYTTTKYTSKVEASETSKKITFNVGARTGTYTNIAERSYLMQFHNSAFRNLSVTKDGTALTKFNSLEDLKAAETGYYSDVATQICYVKVPDTKAAASVVVTGEPIGEKSVFEVEKGELTGNAAVENSIEGYTGTGYVSGISASGDGVKLTLDSISDNGDHPVRIRYNNKNSTSGKLTLTVNDDTANAQTVVFPKTGDKWDTVTALVTLKPGDNVLTFKHNAGDVSLDNVTQLNTIITVPAISEQTLQAEDAEQLGNVSVKQDGEGYQGSGYSKGFAAAGDGVAFKGINVLADATYTVGIRYTNNSSAEGKLKVNSNNNAAVNVSFPKTPDANHWNVAFVALKLKAGTNTITVAYGDGSTSDISIDSLRCVPTPYTLTAVPKVVNGGFETGNTNGWTITDNGVVGRGVDGFDSNEGSYKLYFWNGDSAYEQTISQTVTGLPNGTYMLTAWVKVYNASPNDARLDLTGYNGADKTTVSLLDHTGGWWMYEAKAEVKDGKLTFAFYCNGKPTSSLQLDDVRLWKVSEGAVSDYKGVLGTVVSEANKISKANYTKDSWDSFEISLRATEKVLSDKNATPDMIYGAFVMLNQAKESLVSLSGMKGDVNKDGTVTVTDIVALRKIIMSGETPDAEMLAIADLAEDGKLTVTDIVALRKLIMS